MEVSSQDPAPMAMDLSKGYSVNPLTCSHTEAMDLVKKPEWYHRRPPSCSTEVSSPNITRCRAASSYTSLSSRIMDNGIRDAGGPVHCRDMEQGPETLGSYMNSTLAQGLELYHEGVHGNLWHPGFYGPEQTDDPIPESSGGEESDSGSDVIFLVSTTKDSLIYSSLSQESASPIVEPLSPAALSLDEGIGCYLLPQPLSSPSPDSTYSEDSSDSSVDIPVHHTRPIVLLSDLSAVFANAAESPVDISSDDSDVIELSDTDHKVPRKKSLAGEMHRQNEASTSRPGELRRSARIRKPAVVTPVPVITRRGSRHSLRRQVKSGKLGLYNEGYDSDDVFESIGRLSSSEEEPSVTQRVSSNSDDSDMDTDSKGPSKSPRSESSDVQESHGKRKKPLAFCKRKRVRAPQKPCPRIPAEQRPKVSMGRKAVVKKSGATRRRRKKRAYTGPSTLFSPPEPEIKLKYAHVKEKKDKSDNFRPFVRMEQNLCTVVNSQEEEAIARCDRGRRRHQTANGSLSTFVPKTSCFQLGRLGSESKKVTTQACCLCGQTANSMGLGDLHGPYYPTVPPAARTVPPPDDRKHTPLCNSHTVKTEDDCCDDVIAPPIKLEIDGLTEAPLRPDECWIHEDCGIWSTGVYLVKAKLYGLGEAAGIAQETVCSTCCQTGAIMGCFQKGCSRNYHYRCAIQSGCVLNDDNFSMRCPEHKNKPFASVNRRHRR